MPHRSFLGCVLKPCIQQFRRYAKAKIAEQFTAVFQFKPDYRLTIILNSDIFVTKSYKYITKE
ncbi:MAG: hypothetical protein ACERKO_12570, partial [Acetanaerobacterium sp.]